MKRLIIALLVVMLVCGLTACSGAAATGKTSFVEIDAASEAEKIVAPGFALETPSSESEIWTSDMLSGFGSLVYYIGSDSEMYYVNRFDCDTMDDTGILSSVDKLYYDVSVDSDGVVYVLAASANEDGAYEIIKLNPNGNSVESYPLRNLGTSDGWIPSELEVADGVLFIVGNEQLVSAEIGTEIKTLQTMKVQSGARLARSHAGEIMLAYIKDDNYCVDVYSLSAGKLTPADSVVFNMPFTDISCGAAWDVYLSTSGALFGYRFETGDFKKLFSWNGIGLYRVALPRWAIGLYVPVGLSTGSPLPCSCLRRLRQALKTAA